MYGETEKPERTTPDRLNTILSEPNTFRSQEQVLYLTLKTGYFLPKKTSERVIIQKRLESFFTFAHSILCNHRYSPSITASNPTWESHVHTKEERERVWDRYFLSLERKKLQKKGKSFTESLKKNDDFAFSRNGIPFLGFGGFLSFFWYFCFEQKKLLVLCFSFLSFFFFFYLLAKAWTWLKMNQVFG